MLNHKLVSSGDVIRECTIGFLWPLPWASLRREHERGGPEYYYSSYDRHFRKSLGQIRLNEFTTTDVADALERIRGKGQRLLAAEAFGMFIDYAFLHGLLLPEQESLLVFRKSWLSMLRACEQYEEALREPFVREFDITGRSMVGWILVAPEGIADDDQLEDWIGRAVSFVTELPPK